MGRPAGAGQEQSLTVVDNRTGKKYEVPIKNNAIQATAFKQMKAPFLTGERKENETDTAGLRVFDPGFMNTAVLESKITFIDGGKGILRYRGYPIEELVVKSSGFLETSYLLIWGELPTKQQLNNFEREVLHHTFVHQDLERLFAAFRYDSHPMSIMVSAFSSLGAFSPEANPALAGQRVYTDAAKGNLKALAVMDKQIFRLLGKSITIAAMAYRIRQGRPFNRPPAGLSFVGSFLWMLDYLNGDQKDYTPHPVLEKALDVLFQLHADHELNASTATMLQVGSTLADPYSAVAAATAALYGPSHGGANQAVIEMLIKIGSVDKVPEFLERVKRKDAILSGFGHRVYKTSDPRSHIVRKIAEEVFEVTGRDPLIDIALALQEAASKDEYFTSRNLAANVDFFTGLIYRAIGIPSDYMTVLFAIPRVTGWLAHWRQMMLSSGGSVKIWRPRQVYTGETQRDWVDIKDRQFDDKSPAAQPTAVSHLTSIRQSLAQQAKSKL
ncbi:uncharacterized protein L969DRAFT_52420 [Mixia osmundae IAM 14324]|uniref:Citrate synthase n=1 Tax=Mixia osmundae (strain CBS 9802 / IAM 14324 / JCM 22182 / KY 12970) TaxID=764103 RepID=G7E529_MIXOS|nr:uncharacterized protein L969DRAFT_52420 [Mixia osmundae IAM 14324]KEI37801.1 hypothetical protein L969DRAFT_52420 [Mixia osmundae IAM 14324]GAA97939.1 hypothetical protein E5Q_04619 [Mixia osmundae IAM 14324]